MTEEEKTASRAAVIAYWWSQPAHTPQVLTLERVPGERYEVFIYGRPEFDPVRVTAHPLPYAIARRAAEQMYFLGPPQGLAYIFHPRWNRETGGVDPLWIFPNRESP